MFVAPCDGGYPSLDTISHPLDTISHPCVLRFSPVLITLWSCARFPEIARPPPGASGPRSPQKAVTKPWLVRESLEKALRRQSPEGEVSCFDLAGAMRGLPEDLADKRTMGA
jgi:hypothetical protein